MSDEDTFLDSDIPEYSAPDMIEAEIETLMTRLLDMDPDAMLRLEALLHRMRVRHSIEKTCKFYH